MSFPLLSFLTLPVFLHFAPSATENNRYAKISLLPDNVRVSYTVYFGERPGALARRRIDANGNGVLEDEETRAFGEALLEEIRPYLDVELDGTRPRAAWRLADVGVGIPTVHAGSFSVDLVLRAELPAPRLQHSLWLEDRWPVSDPGETEVRVEPGPGVEILASHVKRDGRGSLLHFRFLGGPGEPGTRGILVRFAVDPALVPDPNAREQRPSRTPLWIALGALAAGLAAAGGLRLYRKMKG